ncbi:putative ATP-dependent helicase YqhH [Lentibacillus sp. JNUCC-1]|uniref:DEAD/DEAH box helicase n=1 Tax=Lentibacillus sp. JNUCC-1 TaxID=2654513 RepID=UPI0012E8F76A|nr:SNF2-related protein [Lentibacillus sp. JNUCC-1]MUV39655.1 putative ATP-dependent helicase YqhH [Lentibacillus sp. JNUCC-1]
MNEINVKKDQHFINHLETALENNEQLSSWSLFKLAYDAQLSTMTSEFDGLTALKHLNHMTFLPYQTRCAHQVVEKMNGRALLADEVGLGKTIEAGLILKEYMVRGLINKALILVPASLVNQWVRELNEKFFIPAASHRKNYPWQEYHVVVSSMDKAKKSPHREQILDIEYDFVLIDEAHKLKNHQTKNYTFARSIRKKYCLLLTATPVQNKLMDIFNLVSILKPGHLGNYDTFMKTYGNDRKLVHQDTYLKTLIQKVMIRNTRKQESLLDSKRHVETVWVDFSEEEIAVYNMLESLSASISTFAGITLLRELCSSREACYLSFEKMLSDNPVISQDGQDIISHIQQLPQHAKGQKLVELINNHNDSKIIVFTEYRATQVYLQWLLQQHGISSVPYRGGFKKSKKDWMKQLFENHAQVLIATEAGGEGINLQFCNLMINYDLPWNPMRLEQRIGRIHRYGQKKDVYIYNMGTRRTIEEHIMTLLYEKIGLFEDVIGQLDDIMADLEINDLEEEIKTIYSESSSAGEAKIKLDNLTSVLADHQKKLTTTEEVDYGN